MVNYNDVVKSTYISKQRARFLVQFTDGFSPRVYQRGVSPSNVSGGGVARGTRQRHPQLQVGGSRASQQLPVLRPRRHVERARVH